MLRPLLRIPFSFRRSDRFLVGPDRLARIEQKRDEMLQASLRAYELAAGDRVPDQRTATEIGKEIITILAALGELDQFMEGGDREWMARLAYALASEAQLLMYPEGRIYPLRLGLRLGLVNAVPVNIRERAGGYEVTVNAPEHRGELERGSDAASDA